MARLSHPLFLSFLEDKTKIKLYVCESVGEDYEYGSTQRGFEKEFLLNILTS